MAKGKLKKFTSVTLAGALVFGSLTINAGMANALSWTSTLGSALGSALAKLTSSTSSSTSKTTTSTSKTTTTTTSSSTSKTTTTTTTASSNQNAKNQLTQQLNANTTFTTSQKVDIQKAIDNGTLKGAGTSKTTVEAQLDRQATAAEAAAFLLRSVGVDAGNGSNFYNEMQSQLKNLGVNIDAKKEVSAADVNKIAQAVAQQYGTSNLAAFNSSEVAKYASDGNISRGELLLLLTTESSSTQTTTPTSSTTSSSSPIKGTPVSSSSGSSSYSYSTPSYSSSNYYSSSGSSSYYSSSSSSSYTPKPATVVISPATTHLQDTPTEFKNNPNAKAQVDPNRKYGANVIEQLKSEISSGKTSINFADKYNNWAAKLFGVNK
jgi:Predicted solute binding protein